jgi:hypothetical protein
MNVAVAILDPPGQPCFMIKWMRHLSWCLCVSTAAMHMATSRNERHTWEKKRKRITQIGKGLDLTYLDERDSLNQAEVFCYAKISKRMSVLAVSKSHGD